MHYLMFIGPCTIAKYKNELDATYHFIVLLIGSACFGHYYAHHQELATIMFITTLVVSLSKDGGGSVNVKLWFLVVCVRCGSSLSLGCSW